MPELPDVEGFLRVLARYAQGKRIDAVEVLDRSMLRDTTPQDLGADEILWRARVNPRAPVQRLGRPRRGRLYAALSDVVRESLPAGRVPHGKRWLTRVRGEREARCPRCGARLRRATVAARTACWCPRCQRS